MPFVRKARPLSDPNLRKPNAGLTKYEKVIYDIYSKAFQGVQNQLGDKKVLNDIIDALKANSAARVPNAINWRTFVISLDKTVPTLTAQIAAMANLHSKNLPKKIRYEYNFESKDPRAIAWAQTQAGKRIQGITLETQQAVANLISDGLRTKLTREEIIAQLRQTVGLDKRQSRALGTFYERRLNKYLEDGMTYEQAAAKAEKEGYKYRTRLVKQRAIRIARTEISAATNAGRYLSWMEADERDLLPIGSTKRWITARDERTCDICAPMHGVEIAWEMPFSTGDQMPPPHPNCRCTAVIVPAEAPILKHAPGKHDQQSHAGNRKALNGEIAQEWNEGAVQALREQDEINNKKLREFSDKHGFIYNEYDTKFQALSEGDKKRITALRAEEDRLRALRFEEQGIFLDEMIAMKSGNSASDSDFGMKDYEAKYGAIRDEWVVDNNGSTLKTNASLRATGRVTTKVQRFDDLVSQGTVEKPSRVFRAAILRKEQIESIKVGSKFQDKGFQSVAYERAAAISYGDMRSQDIGGSKVLFDYVVEKGVNVVNVGYGELLMQRGLNIEITGISKTGGYTVLEAAVTK